MGYDWNDFAILYRTNAQSRIVEEILLAEGLPYRLVGAVRFYERREVKDILSYLRFIFNPDDSVALERIVRSEEHTSELQSLMRISYAVFCLKKKKNNLQ